MSDFKDSQEKSISNQLQSALEQLSPDQIRYVVARQDHATDKGAAESLGFKPDTVYHWPPVVKEALRLMAADGLVVAQHIRRRNLAKAMQIKVDGLDSEDERIKQPVATEIIEWEMGKATQKQEILANVTTRNDGPNYDNWPEEELADFIRLVSKAVSESETGEG